MTPADSTSCDAESADVSVEDRFGQTDMCQNNDRQSRWSQTIAERFSLPINRDLPTNGDLIDWWDDELWRNVGPGEFCHPVAPMTLLDDAPDPVWPPLMPPNFLPLVGNGAGDWLCLRLVDPELAKATGRSTDVCHWYHGGGDWLPWGGDLAEALLFDWVLPCLPQSNRRHADPAESSLAKSRNSLESILQRDHPWVRWAKQSLPEIEGLCGLGPHDLAERLMENGRCEIPVRCQLVLDGLHHGLVDRLDPRVANDLGLPWIDLMRWCFDLEMLPDEIAARLEAELGIPQSCTAPGQQDWHAIERHASKITCLAGDLSWGHDILGYCRHRAGDSPAAMHAFDNAIRCSVFTDQSVRLRTHWATSSDGVVKFSARFLREQFDTASSQTMETRNDFVADQLGRVPRGTEISSLVELLGSKPESGADSVRQRYAQMLMEKAKQCQADDPATAARLLYSAGWDLGAEPLKCFGELLDLYINACRDAGWASHQRLAEVHRQGLQARYNL